jgi:hypothetical protein
MCWREFCNAWSSGGRRVRFGDPRPCGARFLGFGVEGDLVDLVDDGCGNSLKRAAVDY